MKIGILTCLASNDVCARAGCLNAFYDRRDFFDSYGPDVILGAMMTCNGCRSTNPLEPAEDPGILEKIGRLKQEKIQRVHVGVCRLHDGKECKRMQQIMELLQGEGIQVIRGTHRE